MLFRSIFLAVAAFATVASAMPAPAPQIPGGGGLPGGGIVDDILDPFSLGSGSTTGGGSGGVVPPIPRGQYDPAGSLQKCHTGILSVVVKIGLSFLLFFITIHLINLNQVTLAAITPMLTTTLLSASSRRSLLFSALFSLNWKVVTTTVAMLMFLLVLSVVSWLCVPLLIRFFFWIILDVWFWRLSLKFLLSLSGLLVQLTRFFAV